MYLTSFLRRDGKPEEAYILAGQGCVTQADYNILKSIFKCYLNTSRGPKHIKGNVFIKGILSPTIELERDMISPCDWPFCVIFIETSKCCLGKEIKGFMIGQLEVKIILFADDIGHNSANPIRLLQRLTRLPIHVNIHSCKIIAKLSL